MFERVYVINLARRVDRLTLFQQRLRTYGWPFREPIVYRAIDGDKVGVPPEFTQGGGAYGCRMSHLRILQDCIMDNVSSVLILEDDADIAEGFAENAKAFLARVPSDWEGLMFGGQHHAPPIDTGIPGIVRVRYAQRTHAYAARPSYMRALQRRWGNATVHIDWQMRDWQHQHRVYAPDPWLIGQAGGRSDIRGAEKPPEWWIKQLREPGPVAVALVSRHIIEELRHQGCHIGWTRDDDGIDVGLRRIFAGANPASELRNWLSMIQAESVGGLLPTVWYPPGGEQVVDVVRQAWSGSVYLLRGESAADALACLPGPLRDRLAARRTLREAPIVLLRCPPALIETLPSAGFHPGYWRDPQRKLDRGLIRICEQYSGAQQIDELRRWCILLCNEADRDGMIVAAVHPALTIDMLRRATDRRVIEITANTREELYEQFRAGCEQ